MSYTPQICAITAREQSVIKRDDLLSLLKTVDACNAVLRGEREQIISALVWSNSAQGVAYWSDRRRGVAPMSNSDMDYIHTYKLLCEAQIETLKALP